jgi:sulfur carrier protein
MSAITVLVNGEPRGVAPGTTVAGLLAELGLAGRPVAVERNLEIVPRSVHATTTLAADDRIEIVTMVGGG